MDEVLYQAGSSAIWVKSLTARESQAVRKETVPLLLELLKRVVSPFAPTAMHLVRMAPCRGLSLWKTGLVVRAAGLH